jgi:hypothetical protein
MDGQHQKGVLLIAYSPQQDWLKPASKTAHHGGLLTQQKLPKESSKRPSPNWFK